MIGEEKPILTNAHIPSADLGDAKLSGANLTGATDLTREQLDRTCGENVKGLDQLDPPLDPPPRIKPCPKQGSLHDMKLAYAAACSSSLRLSRFQISP